ncbi:MAG: hypothetical protein H6706_15110 [Myxococcales bacterium]|nr:hypothetical protein [Myxococcales bacterium]
MLGFLAGCTNLGTGRDDANSKAGSTRPHPLVTVSVQGGAVVALVPAQGSTPPRVRIRAQSLDVRVEVVDRGCGPTAVTLEVSHLPTDLTATWRPLLDALPAEVAAAREAAGGAVDFVGDPEDRKRTPLASERAFEPETLQCPGDPRCVGSDHARWQVWTVRTDRGAGQVELAPGVVDAPAATGPGACATLDAEGAFGLGQAGLVVRHRLSRPIAGPYRFAVWGNNAGTPDVRARITQAVSAAADPALPEGERVLFAVVNGDLTEEGTPGQLRSAAATLDSQLDIPWYATVGERDVFSQETEAVVDALGQTTFALDAGALRLLVMDSGDAAFTQRTFSLLEAWLPQTPLWWPGSEAPPARLVITHVPPFDPFGTRSGGFKSRQDAARLVATLRRAGVPTVLTAHLATFQRQDVAGVEVIHAGGAGAPIETGSQTTHHWLLVEVGAACIPPKTPGLAAGAACSEEAPCAGGLWCDGTCKPCVVVSRQEVGD